MPPESRSPDEAAIWHANPQWRLDIHDDHLVVSAGADEVYLVDEAPADTLATLMQAWQDQRCGSLANDPVVGAAVRQLRRLGALLPADALHHTAQPRAALRWFGQPWPELESALQRHGWRWDDDAALQLCVRTDASWAEMLHDYQHQPPRRTHVLLDLAYHHTLCLGPLVVPGQTACLACFGHRVAHRWGDLPPPPAPANRHRLAGIAALMADHVTLGSRCVEASLALDLRQFSITRSPAYLQPGCNVCASQRTSPPDTGSLALPWVN
ncbi:hypothetical protein AACH06_14275 [Ideonella sp. DXS29W]|uniref:Bacteriocin biosynthesis cyclodehydratase domain-containing protein n=1 Tax=Ideonella lacteola TaxID=2984193 RepID=A0ABU9BPU0_9BURK